MTTTKTPAPSTPRTSPVAAQVGVSAPAGGVDGGQDVSDPRTLPAVDLTPSTRRDLRT